MYVKSNEHSRFLKLRSCRRFDFFFSFCPSIVRRCDGIKSDVPDFRCRYEPTFFSTSFWLFSSSYQKEKCQKNYCFETRSKLTRRHHCPSPLKRRKRLELDFYFLQFIPMYLPNLFYANLATVNGRVIYPFSSCLCKEVRWNFKKLQGPGLPQLVYGQRRKKPL